MIFTDINGHGNDIILNLYEKIGMEIIFSTMIEENACGFSSEARQPLFMGNRYITPYVTHFNPPQNRVQSF